MIQTYKYWLGGILGADICHRDATTPTAVWEKHCGILYCAPQSFKHDGPIVYGAAGEKKTIY